MKCKGCKGFKARLDLSFTPETLDSIDFVKCKGCKGCFYNKVYR